jgi:hypothetical protein
MKSKWLWLLVLGMTAFGAAHAESAGPEFSADLVQKGSNVPASTGKLYVGEERSRMEMSQGGQEIVRITDRKRHLEWILFPKQHKYMEHPIPAGPAQHGPASPAAAAEDPCAGVSGVTCKKLGEETLDGRAAVKWEMEATHQGKTMKSTQWIDKARGVPLRQEYPNGQTVEMKYVGMDNVDGRKAEKWEMVTKAPNQPPMRSFQWYDPQLKMVIRQEFPGGFTSELTNIRVGKQPEHLFTMPAGYERVAAPQGMPPGGAAGAGGR